MCYGPGVVKKFVVFVVDGPQHSIVKGGRFVRVLFFFSKCEMSIDVYLVSGVFCPTVFHEYQFLSYRGVVDTDFN